MVFIYAHRQCPSPDKCSKKLGVVVHFCPCITGGYMKNAAVAISAFSISLNVHGWELMICLGFLGSACVRVANELGRGDAKAVKFSIKMNVAISMIIRVLCFVLVLVFGHKIGYLFTNEKDVADSVSSLSIILAFSILLNGLYPVLSGVAVGAGLQGTVAIISLCSYYVIGIPLGVVLGFVAHWQVKIITAAQESFASELSNEDEHSW